MSGIGTFVAIGDSFTEGLHDPGPDGGYRGWADRVAGALAQRQPGFRYANLAIRGKLLGQVIAEQLPRAVELAPDLVSLAAGGNDILSGGDVDALAAAFEPAVARLQAAGCRVLIFTGFDPRMFPVIRLLRGRIAAYNMHLRGIADASGCDLVDLWSMRTLNDARAWSPDRLHLTADGHRRVALRACEVLGVPVTQDWRVPLPPEPDGPPASLAFPASPASPGSLASLAFPGSPGSLGRARWLAARRADAHWAREYAMPWLRRRLNGTSSGDGLLAKRPDLLALAAEVGQDLF
jgi:lysophospholipase L1-like esterase